MFDKSKSSQKDLSGKTNRIVEGTKIKGDIVSVADFRLDGELIGNFVSKGKLVIGETAKVVGDITCKNLDIEGIFEGRIKVEELLSVKSKAKIKGEAVIGKLSVEAGAEFTATCQMKGTLKKVETSDGQPKPEEKAI